MSEDSYRVPPAQISKWLRQTLIALGGFVVMCGVLSYLALENFKEFAHRARTGEARETVVKLLQLAQAHGLKEGVRGPSSCPASAPMVPPQIQSGLKCQSSAKNWAQGGWRGLGFTMQGAPWFSYGIHASPDRSSCVFYAVGDLNGDGGRQRFELHAAVQEVDGKSVLVAAPELVESETPPPAWWRFWGR